MISSFIYAGILILVIFLAPIAFPIVYASNDDDALLRFFVADRPYSRMEVPGMNSSMVDLSGNASSQAIVYPQRERGFYNYASSGECKYCAGYEYQLMAIIIIQSTSRIKILRRKEYTTVASNIPQAWHFLVQTIYTRMLLNWYFLTRLCGQQNMKTISLRQADITKGNIYHFELDRNRTGLVLKGPLVESTANVVTSGYEQVISLQQDLIRSLIWKLDPIVIYMC
jgi:hypothetical protein